tara:strand:+ start:556 stop:2595 length:2040 start_codon:yes stop_codon:yes gene_type:complete
MTSLNLVSPNGNGHTYSVRFREPLVIEPHSKVYLNFAKFKRNSSIYFSQDQTIEIQPKEVLPTVNPANTSVANNILATSSITIPSVNPITGKTGYTPKQLESTIADLLGGKQNDETSYGLRADSGSPAKPTQLFLYNPIYDTQNTAQIAIGLYKDYSNLGLASWLGHSAVHKVKAAYSDGVGEGYIRDASTNLGDSPYYDNYALSLQHYDYSFQSSLDQVSDNHNLVIFRSNKTISQQSGNIFIGLSSHEIADSVHNGTGGADTDWTDYVTAVNNSFTHSTVVEKACTGTSGVTVHNPVLYKPNVTNAVLATSLDADVEDAVPQAFIGVEITGENAAAGNKNMLNVWRASNYSGNRNNTLTAPRREINRMKKVWSCPLGGLLDGADPVDTQVQMAFQTYWAEGYGANSQDRLEFRIFNQINSNFIGKSNLVFDSKNSFRLCNYNFFKQFNQTPAFGLTTGSDTMKAQKANSQIPFNLLMSAQVAGEGFEEIKMTGFLKSGTNSPLNNANGNTHPISIVSTYQMKISSELARFIGVNQTEDYNPNLPESQVNHISKVDADQHTDESYSIFLKNLPIRAFKNIQSKAMSSGGNVQSAGYAQPIIHDVPTPYSDSKIINNGSGDVVVGTFQPSIKKTLDLENNRMIINSLDVEIRDIETNEISEGLSGSVINFTIEKPHMSC